MKIVVGLAAAATLLAGCGGTGSPGPAQEVSSAPAAPASSASASSASSAPAPSASAAADLVDPCKVVPLAAAKSLSGYAYSTAKSGTVAGSKLCSYVPSSSDGTSLIAQVIALTGSFDTFAAAAEKQLPGAKASAATIEGADQAQLVTADLDDSPTVAVLASADGVFYQVIIGGPKVDTAAGTKAATAYAAALLKG